MRKRLFVDLDICSKCPECVIDCSYFYHSGNRGIDSIREVASFALVCRQCEEAPCVTSCPQEALEKENDGALKRSNLLCIGCNSCTLACPFGTIYPEVIPYLVSKCDFCIDRADGKKPVCLPSCPYGALKYGVFRKAEKENKYLVGENLLVHLTTPWKKKE